METKPTSRPPLPKHALAAKSNNTGGREAFARHFVLHELADTLSQDTLPVVVDMVIQLKALRSYYAQYLLLLGTATIELSKIPGYLEPGLWERLNTNQRQHLEAAIGKEVAQINRGIQRAIDWLDGQLANLGSQEEAFDEIAAERMKAYAHPDEPCP